jgi:hypothetical protein
MADLLNRLECEVSEEERKRVEEHFQYKFLSSFDKIVTIKLTNL